MKIRLLTDNEKRTYDPSGELTRRLKGIPSIIRYNPDPPYLRKPAKELITDWKARVDSNPSLNAAHKEWYDYNVEMFAKTGPQGGSYPVSMMLDILEQSYTEASFQDSHLYSVFVEGRDVLIRLIKESLDSGYIPQDPYIPIYRTNAAVPTARKKGDFLAETVGFHGTWNHVWPDYLGQRLQRNKFRLIHQDSVINVRNIERILTKVRVYVKRILPDFFSSWLNPDLKKRPIITKFLRSSFWSVEGDYEAMDAHVSRRICEEVVLPIYEAILDPGEFLHLASFIHEAFEQPVFMGDYMIEGLHNLFSGQGITNDFETFLTVCLLLGTLTRARVHWRRVGLLANGDDSCLIIPKKVGIDVQCIADILVQASNDAGLLMHREKTRISDKAVRFCREVFEPNGIRNENGDILGAYPSALTMNNIVQPEKHSPTKGMATIATLARLDGLRGAPDYTQACQFVAKNVKLPWTWTEEDLRNYQGSDWWDRVYGENYNPYASPSYHKIQKILNIT